MRKVLEFLNDWRDTIYYSVTASLVILLLCLGLIVSEPAIKIFGACQTLLWWFIWGREMSRWMAWIMTPGHKWKHAYCSILGFWVCFSCGLSNLLDFFSFTLHRDPKISTVLLVVSAIAGAVNLFLALGYYRPWMHVNKEMEKQSGENQNWGPLRVMWHIYWKELWDWPRKQKPPAEKKKKESKHLLKKLLDKIADLIPQPLPQPAQVTLT